MTKKKKKNKVIQTGLGLGLEAHESRLLAHYQFCIHKVVGFPVRTTPHKWHHKKPKSSHHQPDTNLVPSPAPAHPELLRDHWAQCPCWAEALAPPARVWHQGRWPRLIPLTPPQAHRDHLWHSENLVLQAKNSQQPRCHKRPAWQEGWAGEQQSPRKKWDLKVWAKDIKDPRANLRVFISLHRTLHNCKTG